ncbi:unnamed protein product [Linum trigynum]|uniref:Uncharacterized protein n=1 Tax=Linum trigynum TaxID=586398 RepID=A0AAV2EJ21_9ROSI
MATISPHLATALLATHLFSVTTADPSSSSTPAFPNDVWVPPLISENTWVSLKSYQLQYRFNIDVARFAVISYNDQHSKEPPLNLLSLDEGEILAAGSGIVYHLYLTAATRAREETKYQTFVFVDPRSRSNTRQLLFVPRYNNSVVSESSWKTIKLELLKSHKIRDIAWFAIRQHVSVFLPIGDEMMQLVSVDEGEVLAAGAGGLVYHLYLTAKNNARHKLRYQTLVLVHPGARWQSLLFEPL